MSPRNPLFATDENQREGDPRVNTWMGTYALKRFGRDKVRAVVRCVVYARCVECVARNE